MRCIVTYIFLLCSVLVCSGQPEGVVMGRVFDNESGNGLQGANIVFKQNLGTIAGENGYFSIKTSPGEIILTFSHIGFKPETRKVILAENDTVILNVGLSYEAANIEQVVVSAGRVEQRISDITVSMNLLKPENLSKNHITDAKELINKTSGIEVMDGQASVRGGSGFSYGAGSRVLALIDGLPVLSADAGNIRWQFLPLENISQIEIIKGASSVAYGSSALNGIINFRTADAPDNPQTRFFLETGVFGTPANVNWKWWDTPRFFGSVSFSHLRKFGNTDFSLGIHLLNDNGYRKLNENKLGRINFKLKHFSKNIEGLNYGLSFNGGSTTKTDFVLWENAETGALKQAESTAIELNGNFLTIDPFISFKSAKNSNHDFRARLQSSDNKFPESDQNNSQAFNFYAEYQFGHKFSENYSLISGLSQNLTRVNSAFYGNHRGLNAGAFTQFEMNVADRLRLTSGVRIEQNRLDGESGNIIMLFRAGANYRAFDYTFLRASYGQGYRFPSIAEKFAATTLGTVKIFPSPYIRSEKGWNAEVGVKQGIMTDLFSGMGDFALFYTQNIDMIEYIFGIYPNPGEDTFSYGFKAENIEASRVYGFEFQFMLSKTTGKLNHTLDGGYVFMYPVEFNKVTGENTGVMLKYRRKHSGTLKFSTSFNKAEFGLGMYAKSGILNIDNVFLSEQTRESLLPGFYNYWTEKNRGYFLLDASVGYKIHFNYNISIVVKNFTNAEYMGRPGDIQPHRNFSVRLSGNF
jgi:outer membrane cobalamin receptor